MALETIPTFEDFSQNFFPPDTLSSGNKEDKPLPTFEDFQKQYPSKLLKKSLAKSNSTTKLTNNLPLASATQGGDVVSGFGLRKAPMKGASTFHQGIDINAQEGMDVSPAEEGEVIEVAQSKGKGLHVFIRHSDGRITEYNHLSKTQVEVGDRVKPEAIIGNIGHTGVATGPHLDFRVKDAKGNYVNPIDQLELDPRQNGLRLKLKQIPTFDQDLAESNAPTFDDVKDTIEEIPIDQQAQGGIEGNQPFVDRRTIEERIASGAVDTQKPKITVKNPHELVGDQISTIIKAPTLNAIDRNKATDQWLNTIDPSYGRLNAEYRSMSGRNLVDFEVPSNQPLFKDLGHGEFQLTSRLQAGAKDIISAYISGRNKGGPEAGWEAAYFKSQEIKREHEKVIEQVNNFQKNEVENYAINHPYLSAFISGINQSTGAKLIEPRDIQSGISDIILTNAQMVHNLRMLPQGIYTLERYGPDSPEVQKLMDQDEEVQRNLDYYQHKNYEPEDIKGKITKGTVSGAGFLPKAIAVAPLGPAALPILTYVESMHRGNREATKAALIMSLMAGGTHGLGEFLSSGTKVYSTALDKEGKPQNVYSIVGRGLGNKAPFVRVPNNGLSIAQNTENLFLSGEPVSIGSLSTLQRQLIMRGSNALFMSIPTALGGGDLKQTAASLVIGLTFPVGKYKAGSFEEGKLIEAPPINFPSPDLLEPARVEVPLNKWKLVAEQQQENLPGSETGFQAFTSPSMVRLSIDTAALNLLDLKRALKNKELVGPAVGLKASIQRHADLQVAIQVLEQQIPKPTMEFFEKNEALIRQGMKTNWEAVKAKEEFLSKTQSEEPKTPDDIKDNPNLDLNQSPIERLKRGIVRVEASVADEIKFNEFKKPVQFSLKAYTGEKLELPGAKNSEEPKTPDDIKDNPNLDLNQSPIERLKAGINAVKGKENNKPLVNEAASNTFGNIGTSNKWITPDRALFAYKGILEKGGDNLRRSGLTLDDLKTSGKAIWDLTQIAAFHLEDFYHRGIEPSVDELANRFRLTLGDAVRGLQDKDFSELFKKGQEFLDTNIADPFFSRMKQDALEKLPNKFNADQARNILSQHKNEFEWTVGLKEFLQENEGKRINKQELIDIIQKGQVRVEASVADEIKFNEFKKLTKALNKAQQNSNIEEIASIKSEMSKLGANIDNEIPTLTPVQYSLEAGEKLELPGAVNSKEVKLLLPLKLSRMEGSARIDKIDYQGLHFPEPNYVAHYRSNDRTTTDGINISHSEEFQSDWNHDIREAGGYRGDLTPENFREKGYDIQIDTNAYGESQPIYIFGKKSELPGNYSDSVSTSAELSFGRKVPFTEQEAIDYFIKNRKWKNRADSFPEQNPFMQHSWKELVMKRFIRDAVVAKDENGNYKYDGVSWTTARQQAERYGKILERKEFKWNKNNDGTYTFRIKGFGQEGTNAFAAPHELQNISLERFAELTTKEAAQEVRDQENKIKKNRSTISNLPETDLTHYNTSTSDYNYKGQFSLKEAVELRSGLGTWADYDVALVNIAKKIGKRFNDKPGYGYSQKEIPTSLEAVSPREAFNSTLSIEGTQKYEKVHFLEITPSMRESLSKEGQALYGLGGSERLNNPEQGIRNRIVTADVFNQVREDLVNRLAKISDPEPVNISSPTRGTVFNSGLNPDAFIDQVKLLYKGYKDLASFTKDLVARYGEPIRQFAEDFYFAIKDRAAEFNDKLNIKIDNWQDKLNKVADDPAWQIRQGEQGRFSLRKEKSPELEDYLSDPSKHQSIFDLRYVYRGVALAQLSTEFGKVYDSMRIAQRVVLDYQSNIISQLKLSGKLLKAGLDTNVAETIYVGNETQKVFSDTDLKARGLNSDQIQAYKNIRAAIDNVLNLRLETKLYAARTKAQKLRDKLAGLVKGTPEYDSVAIDLLDLGDSMAKMVDYYQKLKDEGYISLQRRGKIAAFIEDTSKPATVTRILKSGTVITEANPDRKIYNHFSTKEEADVWLQGQKKALGVSPKTLAGTIYDMRYDTSQLKKIAIREKLTPSQFEDLVDRSGVSSSDPTVEKIRSEVYSKYPSFTYELNREYVRGYDRTWKNVTDSVVHQADLYGSSFYSKVGGEEAFKALEQTGIEKTDPNLYKISLKYIQDEIGSADTSFVSKVFSQARRKVYLWQLGYDINQLYLNAVAQPITQTYGYFSRLNYNGIRLKGLEPEQYFLRGGKLAGETLLKKASPEFTDIVIQLTNEHVLAPEFTRSLIESEASPTGKLLEEGKNTVKKAVSEHWASVFMRAGEKITRTHAAAEAYLVGKEKFKLSGDDLIKFIVRAVDATQSNPTRGENPYYIRSMGEGGKLIYQFMAFNQMWWENLAIGVKQTKGTQRAGFLARELIPLGIMGGLRGLPLSGFALAMYSLITGRDPRKDIRNILSTTKDSVLENLVLNGVTGSQAMSQKLTPSAPILDQAGQILTTDKTNVSDLTSNIPLAATIEQVQQGFRDLVAGRKLKAAEGLSPRAIRGIIKSNELQFRGLKNRSGTVIESKHKATAIQILGQAINVSPNAVTNYYEDIRIKKLRKLKPIRKLKRLMN